MGDELSCPACGGDMTMYRCSGTRRGGFSIVMTECDRCGERWQFVHEHDRGSLADAVAVYTRRSLEARVREL